MLCGTALAEGYDIYLLIGQSNMSGRGTLTADNAVSNDRIVKFTKEMKWAPADEPLHFNRKRCGADVADAIALAAHPMDRHLAGSSGQNLAFLERPGIIPLSSLVSVKCPNLLAAGGLVAAEPAPFASMRVQAQCMAMGQAAGTAAAFMRGEDVRSLDFAAIRGMCECQGAITRC